VSDEYTFSARPVIYTTQDNVERLNKNLNETTLFHMKIHC